MEEAKYLRIVPAIQSDDQPTPTMGTKVFVGGQELAGITKIEMVCGLDDVWRAVIHCLPAHPLEITCLADVSRVYRKPSFFERLTAWLHAKPQSC